MNMNPFLNAFAAALYIVLIVNIMNALTSSVVPKETLLIPMTMLSLFVLSAAFMGFVFMYKPFQLYFDNRREEALSFFIKTVGAFACFTLAFIATLLLSTPQ